MSVGQLHVRRSVADDDDDDDDERVIDCSRTATFLCSNKKHSAGSSVERDHHHRSNAGVGVKVRFVWRARARAHSKSVVASVF